MNINSIYSILETIENALWLINTSGKLNDFRSDTFHPFRTRKVHEIRYQTVEVSCSEMQEQIILEETLQQNHVNRLSFIDS